MPIVSDERAFAALRAAGETLERDLEVKTGEAPPESVAIAAPHGVYVLGLDALLAGSGQEAAAQTGWRCMLVDGKETVGAVEIAGVEDNPSIASVSGEGLATAFGETVRAAEGSIEAGAGDYEARLLRVPAVYAELLWLRDQIGGTDLFAPVASVVGLESGTLYRADEVMSRLREEGARIADFDSSPRGEAS
jgi:hypothetical protein